jgi:type II secretion system protein E
LSLEKNLKTRNIQEPGPRFRISFDLFRNFPYFSAFLEAVENHMAAPFLSIKTLLDQAALVTPEQFETWSSQWRTAVDGGSDDSLLAFFSREKGITEETFLKGLAKALNWPFVDLQGLNIPAEIRQRISTKVAFQYTIMPALEKDGELLIAASNPFEPGLLNAVQFEAAGPVRFGLAPRAEIEKALKKYYGVGAETLDELEEDEPIELIVGEDKEITDGDQEASVIKFMNQIIWEAFQDRATDIHFEPAEDELRIRYRVDGILHQAPMPPQLKRFQSALISRVKVMSGMDIAEKRLPQDGRINVRIKGEEIDIRVSTVPTVYGESVSLRLLTRGKIFMSLDKLGFDPEHESALRELIVKPHGIILVTGPTGSGKSTSLYAFLSTINSVQKRIITIEDPVEYELKGINQIPVRSDIGLTFSMGLRHILRQDPNVVMVGEIRDLETAEIAIRAALTGHLVFSTLHTNDAPSAFTRLIDMGIEPFLVASSVEAVMAQRLVRTICKDCKTEQKVDPTYLRKIGFPEEDIAQAKFYHGAGCETCHQLGYKGRIAIYELLVLTEVLRPLILNRSAASTLAQKAMEEGMRTLRMDGWRKVQQGVTTIEEVLRVTQTEEHMQLLEE